MAQQLKIGQIGIDLQAAKGTAGATPALVGFGLLQGKVLNVPMDQPNDDLTVSGSTGTMRISPTAYRNSAYANWSFDTRVWPISSGLLLYGALGAINSVAGTPNVHTITPGADLPYLTFYGKEGSVPLQTKTSDCKIDTLTLSWDVRAPLVASCSVQGISPNPTAASFTVTNDEAGVSYFTPPNALASYQLDVSSATPATANVKAATVTIANNLSPIDLSASITPNDIFPGQQQISGSITIVPADYTDWIKAVTGTGTGTSPSNVVVFGSFSLKVALDANTDLTLTATKVKFTPDLSDVAAAGGAMELQLPFEAIGTSSPFTAVVRNTLAAYVAG